MKHIYELKDFEPQLVDEKSGPEPSLEYIIEYYYQQVMSAHEARSAAADYIEALFKEQLK